MRRLGNNNLVGMSVRLMFVCKRSIGRSETQLIQIKQREIDDLAHSVLTRGSRASADRVLQTVLCRRLGGSGLPRGGGGEGRKPPPDATPQVR